MRRLGYYLLAVLLLCVSSSTFAAPASSQDPRDPFLIVPGQSIGRVVLGMHAQQVAAILGKRKGILQHSDGTVTHMWYEDPENTGIGVRATRKGTVYRIWVLNDPRYATREGLKVGSLESEVRAALGKPNRVEHIPEDKDRDMLYDTLGVSFTINLDSRYDYYNAVYEIGVFRP